MDLWQHLVRTDKHVVMYGMGNGADKILAVCERYGIVVEEFFASDEFVRGQMFHGKTVWKFSDIVAQYGEQNIIVLVAFASCKPTVMEQIAAVARICETYIPDVPVRGETLFCAAYEEAHRKELEAAIACLADERSREVVRGVLEFRRTGRIDPLFATADAPDTVLDALLHTERYRTVVDAGAYDGDTARDLIARCPNIERVFAIEPDRRNYRKLLSYAQSETRAQILPVAAAAWDKNERLIFDDSGNRNAGLAEDGSRRRIEIQGRRIDDIAGDAPVDFIKYDVEGSEKQALTGSEGIIRRDLPDLLVSLYHRTEDLHALILQVRAMCPEHRLYVRRYPYIPAWDLNLYAIKA